MRPGKAHRSDSTQDGYTLVAVLLVLLLISLAMSAAGPLWSQSLQRERERELLRVGRLYVEALERYRDRSPGSLKQFPEKPEQLLSDTRFVGTMRHLRKLYGDPLQPGQPLVYLRDSGGFIVGVRSSSSLEPFSRSSIRQEGVTLPPASRYSDWTFTVKDAS